MFKAITYDHTGKTIKETSLPGSLFNVAVNPSLIAQAVHVYRSNAHQGFAYAQSRGDVDRTTAKWYKQKGTGRARHGARSAPLFVGGGQAFGPQGINAANLKLTQKMKRLSTLGVLSSLAEQKAISLVADFAKLEPKTKNLQQLLAKMSATIKPTILLAQPYTAVTAAAANIHDLDILPYSAINAYQLLNTKHLIIDESALEPLQKWLAPTKKNLKSKI